MASECTPRTFFRKAPPGQLMELYRMLNGSDEAWKDLASVILRRDKKDLKFSSEDIDQFAKRPSPSKALFDAWANDRPNLEMLRENLITAGLKRAAVFVTEQILNETCSDESASEDSDPPVGPFVESGELLTLCYRDLSDWTDHFCNKRISQGGSLLGSGGFGSVYLGKMPDGKKIAVKKLKMDRPKSKIHQQLAAEVKGLSSYKHENLMALIGFCDDDVNYCIIYEYLPGGNLEDALKHRGRELTAERRISIAVCTARAIVHLHTHKSTPLIHRDIKTANILLDANMTPKLGDFGLARLGPDSDEFTHDVTENVIGTTVYMSAEYKRGTVSVKLDAYSYGVVLLELLSGQKASDSNREEEDIITFVECQDDLCDWLDRRVSWPLERVQSIYGAAMQNQQSFLSPYASRPTLAEKMPDIELWLSCG